MPREFWIKATRVRNGVKSYTATLAPIRVAGEIHVIEKSEYDKLKADLDIAVWALEMYADQNAEIIKSDKLKAWLEDSRANPKNFLSGYLCIFGFTKGFAREALKKIKGGE